MNNQQQLPSRIEFVTLLAMLTSITALAIDTMLPALSVIGDDLNLQDANQAQWIISVLFLGMALGQLFWGPLSDSVGRKPLIYVGLSVFMLGSLVSLLTDSFTVMLIGRFLQGLGSASTRVIGMALVRDCFSGRAMAQIMSFTMAVFIMVPALAPALGAGIMWLAGWHAIFAVFIVLALILLVWFALRMPETLPAAKRTPYSWAQQKQAAKVVLSTTPAMLYTLAAGVVFGGFLGYLNSAQQMLGILYGLGAQFPLYFAVLALSIGAASLVNARLVMRFGMRLLSLRALWVLAGLSLLFLPFAWYTDGQPPLWVLMLYFMVTFFCLGLLFGNLNALAMEPLGQYAGMGASIVGALSMFMSVPLGAFIGQSYNGTVLPLVLGFTVLGGLSMVLLYWAEQYSDKTPLAKVPFDT